MSAPQAPQAPAATSALAKKHRRVVVLVSGGMDSLVTAAIAHGECAEVAFLHLNYGQRTEDKELVCFQQIADHYHVPAQLRKVVDLSFLAQIGGSSLTDSKIPVSRFDVSSTAAEIPSSYVPFRNTIIISLAVSWAEVIGATGIYIGAVFEDSSGYPDCRPSYYAAFNHLIVEGTKAANIKIETPIIHMGKDQIVQQALAMQAPLSLTWSCYAHSQVACGVCDSCALRLRGFQKSNVEDPIPYATRPRYN